MAQYYNGQYQAQPQQPQSGHPDPYNRQQSQYAPADDQAYSPNQRYSQQYPYSAAPPLPARNNSTAVRQNNELFMDSGAPSPSTQSYAHSQHYGGYGAQNHYHQSASTPTTYNPQDYAGTVSPAVSPPMPGVTRMPSFPATNPLPYNPADYAESNLQRASSSANRYSYIPAAHTSAAAGALPSPSLYQNTAANRPLSMHSGRPQVQTSFAQHPSHYATLAPPPLPAIPGSADSPADDWGQVPSRYNRQQGQGYDYPGIGRSPSQLSPGMYQPLSNRASIDAYGGHASPSYLQQSSNSPSPGPTPPPHSTQYGTEQRPVSRPLPRLPSDSSAGYFGESGYGNYPSANDAQLQEDLEHQIMNLTTNEHTHHATNGYEEDEDDDPEALAGLAAMREAELQDEAEARRASGQFFSVPTVPSHFVHETRSPEGQGSDSDVAVDLSLAGGGFDAHMTYGGDPNQLMVGRSGSLSDVQSHSQTVSSSSSMRRPNDPTPQGMEPAQSPGLQHYRSDAYGTGGLSEPSTVPRARRLSYDEGDEGPLMDYSTLAPGEPTELFFHPGMSTTRPLPPPPSGDSSASSPYPQQEQPHHIQFPPVPAYSANQLNAPPLTAGPALPRHLSEKRFGTLPAAVTPARSKTDAEARGRQQRPYSQISETGTSTPGSGAMALDLPSLTKKFNPQKLTARDFQRCTEPWAVSAVVSWLKAMIGDEQYLKRSQLQEALIALFTTKIPTMQIAVAEVLSDTLLDDMEAEHVLYYVEEWLQFGTVELTGVLYQLTGSGCYASRLHDYENYTKCYAPRCQRTERKIDLSAQPAMGDDDWASYYIKSGLLTEERVKELPKDTVRIQNVLHEIIQKEENYVREIAVLTSVYRDGLASSDPPVIGPKRLQGFVWEVFGKAEAVKNSNEQHLLPQMKYRQKEQGPFISGFSDILREWVRKARPAYLEYASQYPHALYKLRQELDRNMLFRAFVERCQLDPRSKRLDWSHFLKLPITRIQQFKLLLQTAAQKSEESKENDNLKLAIAEVDAMVTECNTRVGDGSRKVDLTDLQNKLKLRPGMQRVDLNLDHLGREVLYQGDLLRIGGTRFTWLETHAILFDHYLVLAKATYEKGPDGMVKSETYDVSRLPIPMDLLVLETRDDDPVVRSNVLGGRAGVTKVAPTAEQLRQQRQLPNGQAAPELRHSSTSTSLASLNLNRTASAQSPAPQAQGAEPKEDKTLYPFRLKHLGKQPYTLYASSWQNREDWCNKIEEAKTKHAAALFTQNAEPFKLRVMADSAFAYDGPITGQKSIVIQGTPLDRAIRDVEKLYANTGRPGPVCRAKVNCATAFYQSPGKQMVAVGTDFGVYISDVDNPRGWQRVINHPKVTQIAVLEEFSILLLISDKALIAYHLDQVCPASGVPPQNDNARRAPQKLSGSKDVGFFATGRMKDRTLVFYKKRDGISSTFKVMTVLEPVYQKSTEKRSRFPPIRSGKTDFFRDFDEFYIPTECMGMNMFHSSLAICTQKGFEILTLDKKQPISIPDLEQSHVQMIANRLAGQKPLGMFRLSEQEFLLCYEECAVYVNKHGDISRSVIMEFVGKARAAALYGPYVLLFDPDFVEIRNAQNGRLRQVIAGRDVRCLDDAVVSGIGTAAGSGKSVKIALQHPANEKLMVLLELLLNEGTRE